MDVEAIADRAGSFRISRLILTVIAAPLYVVGFVAAVVWLSGAWLVAAALVGWSEARSRLEAD